MKRAVANEYRRLWNGSEARRAEVPVNIIGALGRDSEGEPCEMFPLTLRVPLQVPVPISIHAAQLRLLIINTFQIKYNYKPWSMMEF